MKSPPSTTSASGAAKDADVMLSHTIDDDITFERVRHMPRRTQFVSTHRKLSWQYDKEMKQHERDQKITHVEMARAKIAMAEKLSRLQDAKKEMQRKKGDPISTNRRSSAPCLPDLRGRTDPNPSTPTRGAATPIKHSHSASSFPLAAMIPEDTEMPEGRSSSQADKRVSFTAMPDEESGRSGRRATIAEGVVEASNLPPHLVRRLSEFMDSTSSLLMSSSSRGKDSASSMPQQRQSDPGPLSALAERAETQTEVV